MMRLRRMLAVLLLLMAPGCAQIGTQLPQSLGGMPADAPARPASFPVTPDVHDLPPERPVPALSEADQLTLERDLAATRARQQKLQQSGIRQRGDSASAAAEAARDKAKAAAKPSTQ